MAERPIDELKIKISVDEGGDVGKSLDNIIAKLNKIKEVGGGKSDQFSDLLTTLSNMDKSLSKISTSLTKVATGITRIAKTTDGWSGKFSNDLNDIGKGMADVAAGAEKAAKATKGLMTASESNGKSPISKQLTELEEYEARIRGINSKLAKEQALGDNADEEKIANLNKRLRSAEDALAKYNERQDEARQKAHEAFEAISELASKANDKILLLTDGSERLQESISSIKINTLFDDTAIREVTESLEGANTVIESITDNAQSFQTAFEDFRNAEAPYKQYDVTAIDKSMQNYLGTLDKVVSEEERLNAIDMSKHYSKVDLLKEKYNELADKLAFMLKQDSFGGKKFADTIAAMQKIQAEMDKILQSEQVIATISPFEKVVSSAGRATRTLISTHLNLRNIVNTLGRVYTFPFTGLTRALDGIGKRVKGLAKTFLRTARMRMFRYMIRSITAGLKEGVDNAYEWSRLMDGRMPTFAESMDRISTATLYLKNSLGALVTPIINAVAPAFDYLIDKVVDFINIVNQMIARLTGATIWQRAVRYAKQYKDEMSGAAASAGKLAEELITILGIDEINPMAADKGRGSGSGGGSGNDLDYSAMFVNEQVEEASSKLADLFTPFKKAWDEKGATVMASLNKAMTNVSSLIGSIKDSFWTVWTNGEGEKAITHILNIFSGIASTIGNIAKALETGWNTDNLGTSIFENVARIFNTILSTWDSMVSSLEAWSEDLDFTEVIKAVDGLTKAFDEFLKPVSDFVVNVWEKAILPFAKWIVEDIAPVALQVIAEAFGAITAAWELVSPAFSWLWENILSPSLGTLGGAVKDGLELIRDVLASIKNLLQDISDLINGDMTLQEFFELTPENAPTVTQEHIDIKENLGGKPSLPTGKTITAQDLGFERMKLSVEVEGTKYTQKFDDPTTSTTANATKFEDSIPKGSKIIADTLAKANALDTIGIPAGKRVVNGLTGGVNSLSNDIPNNKRYLLNLVGGVSALDNRLTPQKSLLNNIVAGLTSTTDNIKNKKIGGFTSSLTSWLAAFTGASANRRIGGFTSAFGSWAVSFTGNSANRKIGGFTSLFSAWQTAFSGNSAKRNIGGFTSLLYYWSQQWQTEAGKSKKIGGFTSLLYWWSQLWQTEYGKKKEIGGYTSLLYYWSKNFTGNSSAQKIGGFTSVLEYLSDSIPTAGRYISDVTAYVKSLAKGSNFQGLALSGTANTKNGKMELVLNEKGGVFSRGFWKSIPQYAGGTLNAGTVFAAGESGPEIVGHVRGRTEVLNQSQIAQAMAQSMEAATASQNRLLQEQNTLLRELIQKQGSNRTSVSSGDIIDGLAQRNRRDGRTVVAIGV